MAAPNIRYSEVAEEQIGEAYQAYRWLLPLPVGGLPVAERWLIGLTETVEREAALAIQGTLRRPLAEESPANRPLFRLLYRAAGRGSSAWRIAYEISDTDSDGALDTLTVVTVVHVRPDSH